MKKYLKQYWVKIFLLVLVLLIVIPLVIHLVFKIHPSHSFFSAEWTAGELLLFYGSILASLGAITGVFFTVKYSQQNYQEDVRKRVLPYITITRLSAKHRFNIFRDGVSKDAERITLDETVEPLYEEQELDRIYYIYEDGVFEAKDTLPKEYIELLELHGLKRREIGDGTTILSRSGYMSFPLIIENVGCGPAINFRIGLNKKSEKELFVRPIQLKNQSSLYIHIFVPEFDPCDEMLFSLTMVYQDIYKNKYRQDFPLTLTNTSMELAFEAEQVILEESKNG